MIRTGPPLTIFTRRLLPLLLEWLQAHDSETREKAAAALLRLMQVAWPRMAAHAGRLWEALANLVVREAAAAGTGAVEELFQESAVLQHALEALGVLAACGGLGFTEAVQATKAALAAGAGSGGSTGLQQAELEQARTAAELAAGTAKGRNALTWLLERMAPG